VIRKCKTNDHHQKTILQDATSEPPKQLFQSVKLRIHTKQSGYPVITGNTRLTGGVHSGQELITPLNCLFMLKYLFSISFIYATTQPLTAQFTKLCQGTTNGFVVDFALYQNDTFATGFFTNVCGKNTGHVAKWNGAMWEQGAMGGIDAGHALEVIGDAMYIASYEFGTDSNYVVRWNGSNLTTIGTMYRTSPNPNLSQTSSIYDIIDYQGDIVVCGEFNRAAGIVTKGIARWNGIAWDSLGSGFSGSVISGVSVIYPHQMALFENDLIVCGNFKTAGGQTVNGIARWDGQSWYPIGDGFNNTVYGIGVFNGQLFAGGGFTASGSTQLGCIARWNGTTWENPGFGFEYTLAGVQPFIHTIKQVGDSLYITGGFNRLRPVNGAPLNASGVVAMNSAGQVNLLSGGVPGTEIEAIIPFGNTVMIGGGSSNNSGYIGVWNPMVSGTTPLNDVTAVQIYPNPAQEFISLNNLDANLYNKFTIKDISGKTRISGTLNSSAAQIQLSELMNGIYIVEIGGSASTGNIVQRLVVCRN